MMSAYTASFPCFFAVSANSLIQWADACSILVGLTPVNEHCPNTASLYQSGRMATLGSSPMFLCCLVNRMMSASRLAIVFPPVAPNTYWEILLGTSLGGRIERVVSTKRLRLKISRSPISSSSGMVLRQGG